MPFGHGTTAQLKIADSGATMRDFSVYIDEAGLPRSVDAAETTVLGKTKKTYIAGLEDGTINLKGMFDPTVDGYLDGIRRLVTTWEYWPLGSGGSMGTNVKYSGAAVLTAYELGANLSGAATFTATLQQSDTVTRALV